MIADKTPEENLDYWKGVICTPTHPHRKKFSKKFTDQDIEDYCQRMIDKIEIDIEKQTELAA